MKFVAKANVNIGSPLYTFKFVESHNLGEETLSWVEINFKTFKVCGTSCQNDSVF